MAPGASPPLAPTRHASSECAAAARPVRRDAPAVYRRLATTTATGLAAATRAPATGECRASRMPGSPTKPSAALNATYLPGTNASSQRETCPSTCRIGRPVTGRDAAVIGGQPHR
jgi:hypothetical protein